VGGGGGGGGLSVDLLLCNRRCHQTNSDKEY